MIKELALSTITFICGLIAILGLIGIWELLQ